MATKTPMIKLNPKMIQFLKTQDLSGMIRLSNLFAPQVFANFFPKLSSKQQAALNKIMPVGGTKRLYMKLEGTLTPPIVMQLSQPMVMSVMSEEAVKAEGIKGLKIHIDDLPAMIDSVSGSGDIFGALKGLKGQTAAVLGLMTTFAPMVSLGPSEMKDMQARAMEHFKPVLRFLPT
ncbi:MAG: hypothetical protein FWD27_05475 [Coriobacteriia bacterium]|nr:hypothetical protein [Coriobacteriia bacterium]